VYTGVDLGFRKGGANLCDCGSLAASSQLFCVHGKWVAGVGYPPSCMKQRSPVNMP